MAHLQLILDRLIAENLHGPIPSNTQRLLRSQSPQPELQSAFQQRDDQGLDAVDPRFVNKQFIIRFRNSLVL